MLLERGRSFIEEDSMNLDPSLDLLDDDLILERSEDEDHEKYSKKLRKDYKACVYPKPIKDLVMLIFSMRANRKYISKEINTKLLSIRRISKKDLKKGFETITEIYKILAGPSSSSPEAAIQAEKLTKDFYHVIPFNTGKYALTLK